MKVKKFLKEAGVYKMVKKEMKRKGVEPERTDALMKREAKFVSHLGIASPIGEMFSFYNSLRGNDFWRTIDKGLQARMKEMGLKKPVN